MNKPLNKKLVLVMRFVLFAVGAVLGALAMWQYLVEFPDKVVGAIRIVFFLAAALVPGAVLLLSTKPILSLCYAAGNAMKKAFGRTRPLDIAGALVGVLIGLLLGICCDALLRLFLPIFALRLVIDILVAVVFAYLTALLVGKFISAHTDVDAKTNDGESGLDSTQTADGERVTRLGEGYVLARSALSHEKIEMLCFCWLSQNVTILQKTVDALMAEATDAAAAEALVRYRTLAESGRVRTIALRGNDDEKTALVRFAKTKRFKLIAWSAEEFADCGVSVLSLERLIEPPSAKEQTDKNPQA